MISMTSFMLLAIPIGLVIVAGALIRGRGSPDTASEFAELKRLCETKQADAVAK
jgi:hypothetical protein